MNKVWIIIKREYLTRVKKKMFIVTTILLPILILGLSAFIGYVAATTNSTETIVIDDQTDYFTNKFEADESVILKYAKAKSNESNVDFLTREGGDVLVRIFPFRNQQLDSVVLYSEEGVSLSTKIYVEDQITDLYSVKQMSDIGINKNQIDSINNADITIKSYNLKDNKETNAELNTMIGYITGILMYIIMLLYGSAVMRGVMEEKTNRIAEVIISSVKPFQLMLGKILGIGLVSLTQLFIWLILIGGLQFLIPLFFPDLNFGGSPAVGISSDPQMQQQAAEALKEGGPGFMAALSNLPWIKIIPCFFIYFIGGYFTYASLFAAIGSLVNEDPQEAQQLSIPIMMPIMFSWVILASTAKDPHGPLSVFGSMFPLTSPVVMMARIPYDVPMSEILLSIGFLIGGFLFFTWISAKIYRIGILMYGKKVSWKEIFKWLRKS